MMNSNYMRLVSSMNKTSTGYVLDTYDAENAYSFRQLRTGVTNVCRLRRDSDNFERNFTEVELTDGTLTTWTGANSAYVVKLYNQSSTGTTDFVQTTQANQALIVSTGTIQTKGGLICAVFTTNDNMSRASITDITSYPFSVFSVGSNNGADTTFGTIFSQRINTGDLSGFVLHQDRSTSQASAFIDSGGANNLFNTLARQDHQDQRLQSFTISSGGNGEAWLNGASQETISSISTYDTTPTASAYLAYILPGASYKDITFQELIIFGSDETSNQSAIETNINNHYSIY